MGQKADLDALELEGFFAVLAVESPLWTFSFIVTLLFIGSHKLFTGRTQDNHEVTAVLMPSLQIRTIMFGMRCRYLGLDTEEDGFENPPG